MQFSAALQGSLVHFLSNLPYIELHLFTNWTSDIKKKITFWIFSDMFVYSDLEKTILCPKRDTEYKIVFQ